MAALIREFGVSDFSKGRQSVAIQAFSAAISCVYLCPGSKEPPEQVIEVLRDVMMHNPDLDPDVSLALALCLANRFVMTNMANDYEEAISIIDKFFASHPIRDSVTPTQKKALALIKMLIDTRSSGSAKPEYLEDAISRLRALLSVPSLPEPSRVDFIKSLDLRVQKRSDYFGITGNSIETLLDSSGPGVVLGSASSPIPATYKQPIVDLNDDALVLIDEKMEILKELFTAINNIDNTDVEEIVERGRRTLPPLTHSSYRFSSLLHHKFAEILFKAYLRTSSLDYIDEGISLQRDVRKNSCATLGRSLGTHTLLMFLTQRWSVLRQREDLDEIMQLCALLVDDGPSQAFERLGHSCFWATTARVGAHPSTSVAYEKAMSLLQEVLVFSPTLQTQHFNLVGTIRKHVCLPMDYASYLADNDQLTQAIETLERGRSLLWSEMRLLRTSTDQLRAVDPACADNFTEISRNLEKIATTVAHAMTIAVDNHAAGGHDGLDPFGNLLMQQRKLLEVRGSLISHIRTLPGLENFLKPPSFDLLNSAAALGPIILINQSKWRSDIDILLKDSPPSLISTSSDFHARANRLKEQLLSI
ncbi:hypothetical protein EI94DRAFT_1796941 [Lactarius quietus]|nr:hypothetical protein EI94DRAFT_1796941 [Lactarius quietus]